MPRSTALRAPISTPPSMRIRPDGSIVRGMAVLRLAYARRRPRLAAAADAVGRSSGAWPTPVSPVRTPPPRDLAPARAADSRGPRPARASPSGGSHEGARVRLERLRRPRCRRRLALARPRRRRDGARAPAEGRRRRHVALDFMQPIDARALGDAPARAGRRRDRQLRRHPHAEARRQLRAHPQRRADRAFSRRRAAGVARIVQVSALGVGAQRDGQPSPPTCAASGSPTRPCSAWRSTPPSSGPRSSTGPAATARACSRRSPACRSFAARPRRAARAAGACLRARRGDRRPGRAHAAPHAASTSSAARTRSATAPCSPPIARRKASARRSGCRCRCR